MCVCPFFEVRPLEDRAVPKKSRRAPVCEDQGYWPLRDLMLAESCCFPCLART